MKKEKAVKSGNEDVRRQIKKADTIEKFLPIKLFLLFAAAFFGFSCQPNAAILESSRNATEARANQAAAANNPSNNSFARDLETMRTANFDVIYVFRRKDGAALDGDDKKYIKLNAPPETNRFILSENDQAVIAGSKYKFSEQNLTALRDRFVIEDFSKPQAVAPSNTDANVNGANN